MTRWRVAELTLGCELRTRDTVWWETPANLATSCMTGRCAAIKPGQQVDHVVGEVADMQLYAYADVNDAIWCVKDAAVDLDMPATGKDTGDKARRSRVGPGTRCQLAAHKAKRL